MMNYVSFNGIKRLNEERQLLHSSFELPLIFQFRKSTLVHDALVTDANVKPMFYIRQKLFQLPNEVEVFQEEERKLKLFRMVFRYELRELKYIELLYDEHFLFGTIRFGKESYLTSQKIEVLNAQNEHVWTIRGLGNLFTKIINQVSLNDLMNGGHWEDFLIETPDQAKVSRLTRERTGDYCRFHLTKELGEGESFERSERNELMVLGVLAMLLVQHCKKQIS